MQTGDKPARLAIVVMGVAGSGKTSVGTLVADRLGVSFVDGDDLHPAANVAKMKAGIPLTDDDRWPWLERVGEVLADRSSYPAGVAVACSALRRAYRDRIRHEAEGADLRFLFLDITPAVSQARMGRRKGHFMPVSLVQSQFETLERPSADERDVTRVEETQGVEAAAAKAIEVLRQSGVLG